MKKRPIVQPAEKITVHFDKSVQRVGQARFSIRSSGILPWSDESPELYDLFVTCLDSAGREISCVHQAFGFRDLEWSGGQLQLNHRQPKLIAVNYQMHDEAHGSAWSLPGLVRDLRLIKQHHFNAVRLIAGPADPIFYELCSSFGLYVLQDQAIQPLPEWQEDLATRSWPIPG